MHAAFSSGVPQEDIEFVASHYATITTAAACSTGINATHTIEEVTLDTATRIKNVNPDVTVGMYWRSDFVMEIEECSWFADEWLAHPEWRLKMDNGTVITRSDRFFYIDYSNPDACAFYTKVLVNVSSFLNDSGAPILDYVYIDGDPALSQTSSFLPGIGPARSQQLVGDIYNCFGGIQSQLDERGFDQKVVLNGMDLLPNGPGPWRYYVGQSRYDGLARPIAQPGDRCRAGEVEGPCEEVAYGLEGERYLVEDRGDHLQLSPLVEVLPMVSPPMDEPYFEGNYGFYREQDTAIWLPVGGEYVVDDYRMCARATVTGPGPLPMMQRLCGDPSPMALRTTTGEAVGPVFASQSAVGTDGNAWLHPRDVRYLPGGQPLYPAGEPLTATLTGRWVTEDGDQHVVTEVQWTGTDGDGDRMNDGTAPVVHWPGGAWADGHLFLGTEAERWVDTCHGRFEALTPLP